MYAGGLCHFSIWLFSISDDLLLAHFPVSDRWGLEIIILVTSVKPWLWIKLKEVTQVSEQVVQRGYGVSIFGETQNPALHG